MSTAMQQKRFEDVTVKTLESNVCVYNKNTLKMVIIKDEQSLILVRQR